MSIKERLGSKSPRVGPAIDNIEAVARPIIDGNSSLNEVVTLMRLSADVVTQNPTQKLLASLMIAASSTAALLLVCDERDGGLSHEDDVEAIENSRRLAEQVLAGLETYKQHFTIKPN